MNGIQADVDVLEAGDLPDSDRWLHNFGMAPQKLVTIEVDRSSRSCGYRVGFFLEEWQDGMADSMLAILRKRRITRSKDVPQLRTELDQLARSLPMPPALVVSPLSHEPEFTCDCPMVTAAVLSKTGNRIYLSEKQPRLDGGRNSVVLLLPKWEATRRILSFIDDRT